MTDTAVLDKYNPQPYSVGSVLLSVDHVSLTLDGKLILRDVCAEITNMSRADCVQGQVICFLGPSGIGKTRLSRIIAGLDPPTSGRVLVNTGGTTPSVYDYKPVTAGMVGMVPQNYVLFDFATVAENLAIAASQSPHPKDAVQRLAPLCHELELEKYLHLYPVQLSGGTRQRVAIVRQLLCSDHFVVMDEPFSGLDPIMKQKTCELITRIANMDDLNTVIIVTHDVTEGMAIADHVWVMGQEQDDKGNWLPGARLVETIDFAAQGICWHEDIYRMPAFMQQVADVKARFQTLVPR